MKSLIKLLAGIAPTIALGLGGPVAGGAVKMLTNALDIDEGSPESKITEAISLALAGDPAKMQKIKQADADYKKACVEAGVDLARISADDRDSARKMQIATGSWIPPGLALVLFLLTGVICYFALTGFMTGDLAILVVGQLLAMCGMVVAFYFGSSKGSQDKNEMLANVPMAKALSPKLFGHSPAHPQGDKR